MRRGAVMAVVVALVLAVRGFGGNPGVELEKLQGTWRVVKLEDKGKAANVAKGKDLWMIFESDRFEMKGKGEQFDGKFTLHANKKPKQIDTLVTRGNKKGTRSHGIYELNGNTLKIIWTEGNAPRPTAFSTKGIPGARMVVLQREGTSKK